MCVTKLCQLARLSPNSSRWFCPSSLAGDFGFDPAGLGNTPEALKWYQQAELIHDRTAMAAVAGILIPGVRSRALKYNVPNSLQTSTAAPPVTHGAAASAVLPCSHCTI